MKTIGMLGGMSWESTQTYYRAINRGVQEALGGFHSAKIVLYSVDFAELEALQSAGEWDRAGELLATAAQAVERAGADFLVLCTNTMHKVAPAIQASVGIPFLHIVDATAEALKRDKVRCVGLLGTRFTMEQAFYRERLEEQGIRVITPPHEARAMVHEVIFSELCRGVMQTESRNNFVSVIEALAQQGAEGVVLGCTEISLLVQQDQTSVPLYDTTAIHAQATVLAALRDER